MAFLSDQIDRLTRATRDIKTTALQIANPSATISIFTSAVLYTHLGDLIRDIDPSELGLFTLEEPSSVNPHDKDSLAAIHTKVTRTQFQGATPLKKRHTRQDAPLEIEPEVYAHAALKYIHQYEPIHPMPRAYDRIVNILSRVDDVRQNIQKLTQTLKQSAPAEDVPLTKTRLDSEERNIKELQGRIAELSRKKQTLTVVRKPKPTVLPIENNVPSSPPSQDEQLKSNTGQAGRTLRFTDNLLHEDMNLGDLGETSFESSLGEHTHLGRSTVFAEADSIIEEATVILPSRTEEATQGTAFHPPEVRSHDDILLNSSLSLNLPSDNTKTLLSSNEEDGGTPGTPGIRSRRIKVNREVEKIVEKIWSTIPDTLSYPKNLAPPSVRESILYFQNLASMTPQLESPIASTVSSASVDTNPAPTVQQVLTAHLLTMLLSAAPHYALPLNQIKENLALKAKTSGISMAGQGTTRIFYGCVAKRLVKVDRSGREQIVKFDI